MGLIGNLVAFLARDVVLVEEMTPFLSMGRTRETIVACKSPIRVTPEILECDCPECGGDGDWGKFLFEGEGAEDYAEAMGVRLPYARGSYPCVDCKGTGRIYA